MITKLLHLVSNTPYVIVLLHAAACYTRREPHQAAIVCGFLLNEAAARTLKHVLQQPRPAESCAALSLCDSHGMPSSHAAAMAFALVLHLQLILRRRFQPIPPSLVSFFISSWEVLVLVLLTWVVMVARVLTGHHSVDQVVAGAALGACMAVAWASVMTHLKPVYRVLQDCWLGQVLDLKDSWGLGDVLALERCAVIKQQQETQKVAPSRHSKQA